jgi:CheY-like chemotaxis protein
LKKAIIFSKVLNKKHKHYSIFDDVAQSFGYEVIPARNLNIVIQYMKEKEVRAFFCDTDLYNDDVRNNIESVLDSSEKIPTVLLITDLTKKIKIDKKIDSTLIISLPSSIFEASVFTVYKYMWMNEKLENVAGVINPDFIRKLLSDSAHAINNILTGMQGYAELAQLNPDDKKLIQDSFQVVIDSSYRVRNEIKNLRAFARAEKPQFDRVNIKEILSEAIDLAKSQIKLKGIQLVKHFEQGFNLNADYDQLIQVFFNLINDVVNNIVVKGTAGIILTGSNGYGIVKIIGEDYQISEDDFRSLERIFAFDEPVLKVDSKEGKIENRNVLSICNHIIHNHLGSISVTFADEMKVEYTIKLPITTAEKQPVEEKIAEPRRERHAYEHIENLDMDILIVDDEEYVRNTIYYFFDKKGCRVTLAEDGEFGLGIAKEKPFDLIFMDYLMPKMGGFEAARKILENNKDVKIVFITGRVSLNEEELYKSGVYACIKKPFEMNDLYDIAKKVAMERGIIE